jgi:hypothetical protein
VGTALVDQARSHTLCTVRLTGPEIVATLRRKERIGELTPAEAIATASRHSRWAGAARIMAVGVGVALAGKGALGFGHGRTVGVALAGRGDDSATTGTSVGAAVAAGCATVGVGVASALVAVAAGCATVGVGVSSALVGAAEGRAAAGVGVASALVGVAVLSTDNRVPPCPGRGRTVGGLEGTSVAVGVAVGVCDGATVGVSGGTSAGGPDGATVGVAAEIVAAGVRVATALVGVAFSGSPPDGVALGCGPGPRFAADGFPDARAGVGAAVLSCGVGVVVNVDVVVCCAVGMGVGRPAATSGGCATVVGTVGVTGGAACCGRTVGVALVGKGDDSATTGTSVGVGVAEGRATVAVGVAVLSTDNRVPPCPGRGRTVGGFEGTSVAVGVAVGVAGGATVGVSGGTSAAGPDGAIVGEAEGRAAVGVGVATALAAVAVLFTLARSNRVPPCLGRGRTVGGFEGMSVAVGVAVDVAGGATVGVSGGTPVGVSGSAPLGASAGVCVGVAFSGSPPDGVAAPGPEGSGVALGCGPVPGFAAGGFSGARAGVGAAMLSCGADVAVRVDVAVSGTVGMGVERPAVTSGGCPTVAGSVIVADGAATTVACPVAKDGFPRLGITAGDPADPPVAVASAMAMDGPFCGPRPAALVGQLTAVGEPVGATSPCDTLLGPTSTLAPAAA